MPSKNGHATIVDVAHAAGVSVSTVSRVLNGKGDVSPRARAAVRATLATTGYTASPIARSLVGARTRLIGLRSRRLADDYTGALVRGILDATEAAGYGLLLFTAGGERGNPAAPLLGTLPDGLLVVSPPPRTDDDAAPTGSVRPVVFLEQWGTDDAGPGVTAANREGEAAATRHLLALGHRRLGFVAGPASVASSRERLDGFHAALAAAGLTADPDLIAPGRNDHDGGLVAGRALLRRPDPPTAVLANNDLTAVGVLRAAREAGLRVPEDLSVVGFDDLPPAAHAHPPLTTVRQPLAEMGQHAAAMLIAWVEGTPPEPRRIVLPTTLVVRESCGPPGDGRGGP